MQRPSLADDDNALRGVTRTKNSLKASSIDGWKLTELAFNKLLSSLSPDREEAADRYELLRRKLIRFCESHGSIPAEDRADEIINRVARKIEEGVPIANIFSYSYGVAKMVLKEFWREGDRTRTLEQMRPPATTAARMVDDNENVRLRCFDSCLEQLSTDNQKLLLEYYQEEQHAKIEFRRRLAEQRKIPLNALRIRVHRIRRTLEQCVKECVAAAR